MLKKGKTKQNTKTFLLQATLVFSNRVPNVSTRELVACMNVPLIQKSGNTSYFEVISKEAHD
jgi:hypothetical protein